MARAATIGNGNILVGFDNRGQVRDFYYPFVGEANHVSGASGSFVHRIGVFVDGRLSWLDDPEWVVSMGSKEGSCATSLEAEHKILGIRLTSTDVVHNEQNILLRHFIVQNLGESERTIKLFLAQQFRISESRRGDTGFYDPRVNAIIHYKGSTTILVNARTKGTPFKEYSIGLFGIEGKEGAYMDAQDGVLEKNPIEHGSVDSVLGVTLTLAPLACEQVYYWVACGKSVSEVHVLDKMVLDEEPERLIASTEAYWQAWLQKEKKDLSPLSARLQSLYQRSLIVMRVHTDNRGGVIASSDTDMLHHGRDTYSYVWPRDGAIIAHAFDVTGYEDVANRFYDFISKCLEPNGYLMHKYRSDGVLGSSWHPWIINGEARLPIQEDETATVLYTLWEHYEMYRNIEFIESLYNKFIEPAATFLCEYVEPITGLPLASFDLWEEKYGSSTYTAASVYGGLIAAAKFAMTLGKGDAARTYEAIAQRMQTAIGKTLFDEKTGTFMKHLSHTKDDELEFDTTLDSSSLHGLLFFRVFDVDDKRIVSMVKAIEERLSVKTESEGFIRYEGDAYYRMSDAASPNPWVITTLWIAQYYIEKATKFTDLRRPHDILEWTATHAKSGLLAEQMHPETREQLSTTPLVWSHAEFVITVHAYLDKLNELERKG
jgi:oligosaccharide amylase